MAILFGTLWKNAEQFSEELQKLAFQPLEGELLVWWYIFRHVQIDLQINAQTIDKAQFLTIQEWIILTNTYNTAKEYYYKSVADLIKQKMSASFTSFSAAEPLVVDEKTKEYLIGKNINENDIQRALISFINSLDVHFYNLARISPISKLLREYRNRIGLVMPYDNADTDVEPPTYGSPPIYTSPDGAIELLYSRRDFTINRQDELELIAKAWTFEPPLIANEENQVELLLEHPLTISERNTLILTTSFPLITNNEHKLGIKIGNHLQLDTDGSLNIIPYAFNEPLRLTNNTEVSLGYEAPLYQTAESNLGIRIDGTTIILNEHNQLQSVTSEPAYASPLYINPQKELTLNYTPVFRLNEQQQLDLNISKPLIFDSNHDLAIDYSGGITMLNSKLQLNLEAESPYIINNRQELGFGYDEVLFKINEQSKLDYNVVPYTPPSDPDFAPWGPLFLDLYINDQVPIQGVDFMPIDKLVLAYNASTSIVYKGFTVPIDNQQLGVRDANLYFKDKKAKLVKILGLSYLVTNKITSAYTDSIANKKAIVRLDTTTIHNAHDITELKAETATLTTKEEAIHDVLTQLRVDVDKNTSNRIKLKYTNQLLSQINNRLTILADTSSCSDEILIQDVYRFQNKMENSNIRHDDLCTIPVNKKIVNIKGNFFIQFNGTGYQFANFYLNKLQKATFVTHSSNSYYATYLSYFNGTTTNPLLLRIYHEGNKLKYNIVSNDITPNEGYNIECDFQVIICDSQDINRRTWNLIEGDIFLNEIEWKYKFPNALKLTPTETISLTWIYEGHLYTSSTFRVNYGHWESFYLNGHSGAGWDFKIIDKNSFSVKSADTQPLIQDIKINIV